MFTLKYRFHLEQCCARQGSSASTQTPVNSAAALQKLLSYSSGFSPGSRAASFVRHSVQSDELFQSWSCVELLTLLCAALAIPGGITSFAVLQIYHTKQG